MSARAWERSFCIAVVLAFVGVHLMGLSAPWGLADDFQELAYVRDADGWWALTGRDCFGLFRPVKNVLFSFFAWVYPHLGIVPCRILAIAIGVCSFFAVLMLMKRIFGAGREACFAAAVWLLAPTLVSQIVWLSCLNIQLMVMMTVVAIALHDDRRILGASAAVFLACVSYECAVAVAPMIVAFDYFVRPERFSDRHWWWRYGVVFGIVLFFLGLRAMIGAVTSVSGSFAGVSRGGIAVAAAYFTCTHFLSWFWPIGRFTMFGGYVGGQVASWILVLSWLVLIGSVVLAWWCRRRHPALGLGIVFALVGFLPVSNITGAGNGPYGDYYLSLASIGLSVALIGIARLHRVLLVVLLLLRLVFVAETCHWRMLWTDGDRGLVESTENFPCFFANHLILAQRCCDIGAYDLALDFGKQVEAVVGSESGQMGKVYLIRALYEINVGKNATNAFELIEKSASCSDFDDKLCNRGYYRGCVYDDLLDDPDRAEVEYRSVLQGAWNADSINAADRLARILAIKGRVESAIGIWERALRMDPDNESIRHNLGAARTLLIHTK